MTIATGLRFGGDSRDAASRPGLALRPLAPFATAVAWSRPIL